MNRLLGGLGVLAVSLAAASCGDPTADLRGGAVQVVADPSSVFLTEGAATHIIARVLDEQGNELPDTVTFSTTSSAVTVAYDPTYLVGTDTTAPTATVPSKTRTGIVVTGVSVDLGTITLSSGSVSTAIPFRVLPADPSALFASGVTYSTTTPAVNEVVTVSATGFKFQPSAHASFAAGGDALGGGFPIVGLGISADSNSFSFLPKPGSSGELTLDNVALGFLPAVPISVVLPAAITVSNTPLAGTDAPGTAPTLATPATGQETAIIDVGTTPGYVGCGGDIGVDCQIYKFVVPPGGGTYDFTMTWANTADLGLYFLGSDGVTATGDACDANGNGDPGPAQPEICAGLALAEGTYYLAVVPFGAFYDPVDPNPDYVEILVDGK
jgi:pre-peptidase